MSILKFPASAALFFMVVTDACAWTFDDPFATEAKVPAIQAESTRQTSPSECSSDRRLARALELEEIVMIALCNHPQIRQAWGQALVQAAQFGVAQAAYMPSVTATSNFSRSENTAGISLANPVAGVSNSGGGREITRIAPNVGLNYLLLDFGGRSARFENARQLLEAANWTHAAAMQTVLFTVAQAYYQVSATGEALAAAEIAERSAQEAFNAAKVRYEVGSSALADKLQAQSALAQAAVNRQKAFGDARNAVGVLATSMGLRADVGLQVAAPPTDSPDDRERQDVHALIEQATLRRPDLGAAEAQVKASEASVDTARSASLPTVSVVGNYAYSDSLGVATVQSWSVGLQVQMPLFTGFANTYQIRAAEAQVQAQRADRDRLAQSVSLDVWRAYHDLQTAQALVVGNDALLESAQQSERVALGRYKAGVGSILEALSTQASLANARFQLVRARYDWRVARIKLAQALGALGLEGFVNGASGAAVGPAPK